MGMGEAGTPTGSAGRADGHVPARAPTDSPNSAGVPADSVLQTTDLVAEPTPTDSAVPSAACNGSRDDVCDGPPTDSLSAPPRDSDGLSQDEASQASAMWDVFAAVGPTAVAALQAAAHVLGLVTANDSGALPVLGATRQWGGADLRETMRLIGVSRAALERLEIEVVRESLDRGLPTDDGMTPAVWARAAQGVAAPPPEPAAAARVARLATAAGSTLQALGAADDPLASMAGAGKLMAPAILAFLSGRLGAGKADQIVRLVSDVVAIVDVAELSEVVTTLTDTASDAPDPADWVAQPSASWVSGWGLTGRDLGTAIGHTRRLLKPANLLRREEAAARRGRTLHRLPGPGGLSEYRVTVDAEGAAIIDSAVAALSAPVPGPNGEHDTRTPARRRCEALLAVIERGVQAGGLARGHKAQVVVTISYQALKDQVAGAGVTSTGEVLSPELVRRVACDASVLPMVLGATGEVLDLGRRQRLFSDGQRLALWRRDGHCTFPGCTIPPTWCDAHHVVHWVNGGDTDLANAALLCRRHHSLVHSRGLTAGVTAAGVRWQLRN